jgi:hypothetical protein
LTEALRCAGFANPEQVPATYELSLVMSRGKRFESARRLLFSCDLQENPRSYRSPCDVVDSY